MFGLEGRIIAVVGAGSGIGEAIAAGCAKQGATVICLDVNKEAAGRVAEDLMARGHPTESGAVDVRDGDAVARAFDSVAERLGSLDGIVCTPGVNVRKPILAYSAEEFDRVVDVNLRGTFHVLQAAGRLMTEAGGGSIVLFSSIRAQVVEPGQGVYAATKSGVIQLVRTAAAEWGSRGVRVNGIAPGVFETPLTAPIKANDAWYNAYASRNALGRWGQPEEIVGPAVFLLSDAATYLTGTVLWVDGGWTAIDGRFTPPGME